MACIPRFISRQREYSLLEQNTVHETFMGEIAKIEESFDLKAASCSHSSLAKKFASRFITYGKQVESNEEFYKAVEAIKKRCLRRCSKFDESFLSNFDSIIIRHFRKENGEKQERISQAVYEFDFFKPQVAHQNFCRPISSQLV